MLGQTDGQKIQYRFTDSAPPTMQAVSVIIQLRINNTLQNKTHSAIKLIKTKTTLATQ